MTTNDQIKQEAESFFEWPSDKRDQVTYTSCLLFAKHCADKANQFAQASNMVWSMTKIEPIGYVHECDDYTMSIIKATPGEHPNPVALYTEAQLRQAMEACAALVETQHSTKDEQTYGRVAGELIRELIKEMLL